jgi:hypothetical protein
MGLLIAPQDGAFVWHEVSTSVNRVANDRADLITPLPAPAPAAERVAAQGSLF